MAAEKIGLSSFSLSQLENRHNISVLTLVKVLRSIDRVNLLNPFMTPPEIDPALLEEFIAKNLIEGKESAKKRIPNHNGTIPGLLFFTAKTYHIKLQLT